MYILTEILFSCHRITMEFINVNALDESFNEVEVETSDTNNKDLLCSCCGKEFHTKWGLHRHEAGHDKAHKLKCSVCDASFATRGHYEGHVNVHHDARPHVCSKCNARYAYRSVLLRHMTTCCKGPSEDPKLQEEHKCDICGQTFSRKDILRDHLLGKHEGEQRYHCTKCNKGYRWRSSLKRHSASCKVPQPAGALP